MKKSLKNFITVEDLVKDILVNDEKARYDDLYLYATYVERELKGFKVDFIELFKNSDLRKKYNLIEFGTIERTRRKIQSKDKHLARKENGKNQEEIYKQYARL